MVNLFEINKKTFNVTLVSGKEIKGNIPSEKDYIKITNLEQNFRKSVMEEGATLTGLSKIRDEQIALIFKDADKGALKELKETNVRLKTIVTDEFFKFMGNIDKDPN